MKSRGHPNCETYPPSRIRRYIDEIEALEHEEFGRTVAAMRLAQLDDKSFKKWRQAHDAVTGALRSALAQPAKHDREDEQPKPPAEERRPLSALRSSRDA